DGGRAGLVEGRSDGHSPIGARTAEDDVSERNQSRVGGSAGDDQVASRGLRIAYGESDGSGGGILAGGRICDAGNRRRGISTRHVAGIIRNEKLIESGERFARPELD